ncbi:Uncharacterised protein [Mycobacterium tuberculosis]|nr:Uncharacterised protein [Mycobacterium tuberculosis]
MDFLFPYFNKNSAKIAFRMLDYIVDELLEYPEYSKFKVPVSNPIRTKVPQSKYYVLSQPLDHFLKIIL